MNINDFGRNSLVTHTTGLIERVEKEIQMKHLFKLKKDGKTAGYLNIDADIHWSDEVSIPSNPIDFDTAHPFVTKDKNGKDVFGDDEVESIGNRCRVIWHKVHLQWCLWHIERDYFFGSVSKRDIELIEDKSNA